MKINNLYSNRTDFTIIGLTGRSGSGCSQIAKILSKDFYNSIERNLRKSEEFSDIVFRRKYEISRDYLKYKNNWESFDIIEYKLVLFLFIIKEVDENFDKLLELLKENFRESKDEKNEKICDEAIQKLKIVFEKFSNIIIKIKSLPDLKSNKIRYKKNLTLLDNIFFNKTFKSFSNSFFRVLEEIDYYKRTLLLHHIACNIRNHGTSFKLDEKNPNTTNLYIIAQIINNIIKARKNKNNSEHKNTHIVIDSLRNSLEIVFFKERFSAFYMVTTKDVINISKFRLDGKLKIKINNAEKRKIVVKKLLDLDNTEYKTNDFSLGNFASPDVENCIQKSDYHIYNLKKNEISKFFKSIDINKKLTENEKIKIKNTFLTREEQLMKLISLIRQPGLITPSAIERNMQIANTAKLNSGCISRQVGACITDSRYFLKSLGWNDIPKGQIPCNLRNVGDYFNNKLNSLMYSNFERGDFSENAEFKYRNNFPENFKEAIKDYFGENYKKYSDDLNGKNCSFCFKTVHNYYEGESNQVHTRSLHAEENAMLQLTKFGGMGVENGFLFTTASPCELCSKKAYQLGIRFIYYIDPYPGISVDQIIKSGNNMPLVFSFSGAIGNLYHKLYDQYLSPKDEISMSLEMRDKIIDKNIYQFKNMFRKIYKKTDKTKLEEIIQKIKNSNDIKMIIEEGLSKNDYSDDTNE